MHQQAMIHYVPQKYYKPLSADIISRLQLPDLSRSCLCYAFVADPRLSPMHLDKKCEWGEELFVEILKEGVEHIIEKLNRGKTHSMPATAPAKCFAQLLADAINTLPGRWKRNIAVEWPRLVQHCGGVDAINTL